MKKQLLIISNRYPAGPNDPASPFIYDFKRALVKRGIAVDVLTPYYEPYRNDVRYIDDTVHQFRWSDGKKVISQLSLYAPASWLKIWRYFHAGYKMARGLHKKQNYQAVLGLWALPSGHLARRLHRKFGVPYAIWALGSDINSYAAKPLAGGLILKALKEADRLFADGYELATKVQALADKECRFLPSFHPLDLDTARNQSAEKVFLCAGRLEKEKGVIDLIEAFRLIANNLPDWRLEYIGSGSAEKKIWSLAQKYQIRNQVKLHGYLERPAYNRILLGARIVVIPSHSDSLPLTFGEAMQAGKPVIVSDVGDLPLFTEKYRVGFTFRVGNIQELAEKMLELTRDSSNYGPRCMKALEELDIENAAAAIQRWLEEKGTRKESVQYAGAGK
ncbi:MAG: glycosyltransferase [Candidatus Zixiibacteriota bacterium]